MARIVGAVGLPHNPNFPELAIRNGADCQTTQSYRTVASELRAMRPDVMLIFTTDHLNTFFFENLPILAIGVGLPPDPVSAAKWHYLAQGAGKEDDWLDTFVAGLSNEQRVAAAEAAQRWPGD